MDPAIAAYAIRQQTGRDAIFTLATRDMNRLATQNHLLGAAMLSLDNVIVVGGDRLHRERPVCGQGRQGLPAHGADCGHKVHGIKVWTTRD